MKPERLNENKLRPGEVLDAQDPSSRSHLTSANGDHRLGFDTDGDLMLWSRTGPYRLSPVWGRSGADVGASVFSPENDVILMDDGALVEVDFAGNIVHTFYSPTSPVPVLLVLLYHPLHESEVLRDCINQTEERLQLLVDCFGTGWCDQGDITEMLRTGSLSDDRNESEMTRSYNSAKLPGLLRTHEEISDKNQETSGTVESTNVANSDTFVAIREEIRELNERLRQVGPGDIIMEGDQYYGTLLVYRIKPYVEDRLLLDLATTLDDVVALMGHANSSNQLAGDAIDAAGSEIANGDRSADGKK